MNVDIEACCKRDKQAWDAFVLECSPIVMAAIRKVLKRYASQGAQIEADDPFQDVFIRLVRNDYHVLRSYDPNRASLSTWLTVVARSVTIDYLRRKRLATVSLEPHHEDPPAGSSAATPAIPLHALTDRQRLVLRMLFEEDMTVREAASMLGVDEQTIRSTKHKALTRLRQLLSDASQGEKPGDEAQSKDVSPEGSNDD